MLETKDKRRFLTSESNLNSLVEFSNVFNAELKHVNVIKGDILNLEDLASAISNPEYSSDFEVTEEIRKPVEIKKTKSRKEKIRVAAVIRNHIEEEFKKGKIVDLSKVKKKYERYKLTSACFSSHISTVRKKMEKIGFKIQKSGAGKYHIK
jgi:hypothetical protein